MSHSCSRSTVEYIFTCLLPPLSPAKKVLDVGSRLGAVLYGAHVFTPAEQIRGVELNADFCRVAREAVERHGMADRIKLVQVRQEG